MKLILALILAAGVAYGQTTVNITNSLIGPVTQNFSNTQVNVSQAIITGAVVNSSITNSFAPVNNITNDIDVGGATINNVVTNVIQTTITNDIDVAGVVVTNIIQFVTETNNFTITGAVTSVNSATGAVTLTVQNTTNSAGVASWSGTVLSIGTNVPAGGGGGLTDNTYLSWLTNSYRVALPTNLMTFRSDFGSVAGASNTLVDSVITNGYVEFSFGLSLTNVSTAMYMIPLTSVPTRTTSAGTGFKMIKVHFTSHLGTQSNAWRWRSETFQYPSLGVIGILGTSDMRRVIMNSYRNANTYQGSVSKFNSNETFNADYQSQIALDQPSPNMYLMILYNPSTHNTRFAFSPNGLTWNFVNDQSITNFIAQPSHFFFSVRTGSHTSGTDLPKGSLITRFWSVDINDY